ncbi:MAG: hypothetical protein KW788_00995 [Candidatus Doudnabacteria bacterium]|nr:hypothetical protein [Candidatus Doudnabacteria bacterium]
MTTLKTIIFVVVLLAIGYFLLPYVKIKPKDQGTTQTNTGNSNNNQDTVKTFTSDSLGVKFTYSADQDGDGKTDTDAKEAGDKIYVYYTANPMEQGQWVQGFTKDPKDTLIASIQKKFLANYSVKDCYPLTLADYYKSYDADAPVIPENQEVAVIAYPKSTDPNAPFWQNADKCPPVYSASNGASYFWMDKSHPDKYFFFSIGQYALFADQEGQKAWQDTFAVTK